MKTKDLQNIIQLIRQEKVILDYDLAKLYTVETRVLIQAVKRNKDRFPTDFMFQLSKQEFNNLRSQTVISSWGGRRTLPYAFTEQGIAMLSSILNSKKAIKVNIEIMRTFVHLRKIIIDHETLNNKLLELEDKYDKQFKVVFDAIRGIMKPAESKKKNQLGFRLK